MPDGSVVPAGPKRQRAAFRQSDVTRMIRGALAGGLPVGSFKVTVENGLPVLLPINDASPSDADDCERRMREAFGR